MITGCSLTDEELDGYRVAAGTDQGLISDVWSMVNLDEDQEILEAQSEMIAALISDDPAAAEWLREQRKRLIALAAAAETEDLSYLRRQISGWLPDLRAALSRIEDVENALRASTPGEQ